MNDPRAAGLACSCAKIIETRLGMKISTSNQVFVGMVSEVNRLLDCPELNAAYKKLTLRIQELQTNTQTFALNESD